MNRIGDNLVHFGANEELVRALVAAGVRFVVIGGLAVAWHCSERQADDIDLLVDPTSENSARVASALAGLRVVGYTAESFAKHGLQIPLKTTFYAELLTPKPEDDSFSEVETSSVDVKLFNISIRLASVASLIRMKERAARSAAEQQEKHLRDIKLLLQHAA